MEYFAFSIYHSFACSVKEAGAATTRPRRIGRTRSRKSSSARGSHAPVVIKNTKVKYNSEGEPSTFPSVKRACLAIQSPTFPPAKRARMVGPEDTPSKNANLLWNASAFNAIVDHHRGKVLKKFESHTTITISGFGLSFSGSVKNNAKGQARFAALAKKLGLLPVSAAKKRSFHEVA